MATVNGTLAATSDSCMIYDTNGSYNWNLLDGAGQEVHYYGNGQDHPEMGVVRFTLSAAIPSGATISTGAGETKITFTGNDQSAVSSAYLYVTESADAPMVTATGYVPTWANSGSTTTYPTTMAGSGSINWTGSWNAAGTNVINVGSLVQHLVDTYGGLANASHITFWIDGSRDEGVGDENGFYGSGHASKPTLLITYTASGGATNVVMNVI